jgi:bacillithiol biosynthesis cysteine-adding enzyme BshC
LDRLEVCIRHTDLPGASKLFADFCYDFGRVARFYRHDPWQADSLAAAAREIRYPEARRAAMASALARQNPASELLARFAQPGTVAVVTGQQVGLFSGPAYTVYKALTAARIAKTLTERGTPAVPVFWMATEDHDFAEVNHAWVFNAERQPIKLMTHTPPSGKPAGTYHLEQIPIEELRRALTGFPHAEEVVAIVERAYPRGVTMGAGFRDLLGKLLEHVGVLVLDPLEPAIREIGAPLIRDAVQAAAELKAALRARSKELAEAGYHAQVLVQEKTSLFFLLEHGERTAPSLQDSECAALADRAESVSPNALLRPVWQDFMLPTVAYVGGPSELAYFAQSAVLYDRLLGRMPVVAPRSGFTLLDARAEKLLSRFGLSLPDIMVHAEALRERIARTLVPDGLRGRFTETSAEAARLLDALSGELHRFDPTLAAATARSRAKILYQIEKLRRKTERETLRRDARATSDAAYLRGLLYPEGHMQERLHSILPFLALHGLDLVDRLYAQVRPECPDHRAIAP